MGRSWASSGRSWPALGRFLDVQNRAFFQHWPKMGSKRPAGSILGRFWEGFGRILGGFGRVLEGIWDDFWFDFGKVLRNEGEPALNLNSTLHVKVGLTFLKFFYVRTPALSREAPRSVSMRGGPPPSVRDHSPKMLLPSFS